MADQVLKVTLKKSPIGYNRKMREILRGLGLRKMNQTVLRTDCPPIRGMIFKVKHLVEVEETSPNARKAGSGKSPVVKSVSDESPIRKAPARRPTAKRSPVRETPARKPQSEKS